MASPHKVLRSQENLSETAPVAAAAAAVAKTALDQLSVETKISPPKPPRSAFMCFSDAKRKEIAARDGDRKAKNSEKIQLVADAWKALSVQERAYWDEEARNDKLRFVREKAAYKGPWDIPKRRAKKHPLAPKRPMSAFLKYSQTRRSVVKKENPDMSNTDVSRLLGEMWRNASPQERAPFVEQEERERAIYKKDISQWRTKQQRLDAASRTSHQSMARAAVGHASHPHPYYEPPNNKIAHQYSQEEMAVLHHENRLSSSETYQVPYPSNSSYRGHSSDAEAARRLAVPTTGNDGMFHYQQRLPIQAVPDMAQPRQHNEVLRPTSHSRDTVSLYSHSRIPRRQRSGEENGYNEGSSRYYAGGDTYYSRYF